MDAWLSKDFALEMDEVLAKFRNDYVTILGSNARALTPQEVYDAVTDVHKAQLKAFYLFGKALELKLTVYEDKVRRMVQEKMDAIVPSQVEIKNKFQTFSENLSRMKLGPLEKQVSNLKKAFITLYEGIQKQMDSNIDTKVKLD